MVPWTPYLDGTEPTPSGPYTLYNGAVYNHKVLLCVCTVRQQTPGARKSSSLCTLGFYVDIVLVESMHRGHQPSMSGLIVG